MSTCVNLILQHARKIINSHHPMIMATTFTYRHTSGVAFFFANHQYVWHLLHTVLPDFTVDLFCAQIRTNPEPVILKLAGDLCRITG